MASSALALNDSSCVGKDTKTTISPIPIQRVINYPLYLFMTAPKDVRDANFIKKLAEFSWISVEVSSNEYQLLRSDEFAVLREVMIRLATEENSLKRQRTDSESNSESTSEPDDKMRPRTPTLADSRLGVSEEHASSVRQSVSSTSTGKNSGTLYRLRHLEEVNLHARLQRAQLEIDLLTLELGLAKKRYEVEEDFMTQEYQDSNDGFARFPSIPYFGAGSTHHLRQVPASVPGSPASVPSSLGSPSSVPFSFGSPISVASSFTSPASTSIHLATPTHGSPNNAPTPFRSPESPTPFKSSNSPTRAKSSIRRRSALVEEISEGAAGIGAKQKREQMQGRKGKQPIKPT
ncbi:hypothetical protein Hypma_014051 [Hypsizygus marmoreus]|uniref:Uncharacterized protein n=1 Tax=Hypsizygus marmoreus TaxID=39966 RepID=A0A369KDL1_HYPMA|nr:hypothetical protein Hypma_014051 [Hypsizygus marmoreus]